MRVPLEAKVVSGVRFVENGDLQYMFDLIAPCGVKVRFDHLYTLSSAFAALADTLPADKVDDKRTAPFPSPITVKAGDVIATAVGEPESSSIFIDFGVYDLRQRNAISGDSTWASQHADIKELGWHEICWLDYLPAAEAATVQALPAGDMNAGATSDYCG